MATVLVCPACRESSRTGRELRPAARIRCGKCKAVSRCFVHGNGAVELRPDDRPPPLPVGAGPPLPMPPRIGDPEGRRPTPPKRRIERPIGGYLAFEKSRSWLAGMAGFALVGLALLGGYLYVSQIHAIGNATGRKGTDFWAAADAGRREEFRARQKKAMADFEARKRAVANGN